MSCFIVDKENIQMQSEFITSLLNCEIGFNAAYRITVDEKFCQAFKDCKTGALYDAHKIYRKLYIMNLRAWNARYNENIKQFERYEKTDFSGDILQLYMHMQCYLYQCAEYPVCNSELYEAMERLSNKVAHSIASKAAENAGIEW